MLHFIEKILQEQKPLNLSIIFFFAFAKVHFFKHGRNYFQNDIRVSVCKAYTRPVDIEIHSFAIWVESHSKNMIFHFSLLNFPITYKMK